MALDAGDGNGLGFIELWYVRAVEESFLDVFYLGGGDKEE